MIAAHWQTGLFALAAMGIMVVQALVHPSLPAQVLLLAPLVAILGLPHGALDLPIAEALWPLESWARLAVFAALYLGLAGAVIAVWLLLPSFALLAFLVYSMLHFSDDWAEDLPALRWSGGLATVGAPALLHHAEVAAIFAMLAPGGAALAADAAALAGGVGLAMLAASILKSPRACGPAALELALLWTTAAALPPLMYFAIYFCGLHSIRHFTTTMRAVPNGWRAFGIAVVLSVIVTLVALLALRQGTTGPFEAATGQGIRVIFIGLAALTVPHMILVDRFRRADTTTE
ncbi:MAG: Brp/Blh family beta-carotene 15,15'-dioxygenase [Salibaculum sp.]|uniref:Brp/Blh family beta-carotene 15,15'-dioxygenase n=1 Tax=Salibaculum sp. TaxID=2855480 RepID=UPI0028709092|nr:Brp/Blh family beta-carotene 15,15'-dioxygenase [Salibaculum sp.]MDR9428550.1 Brp/Blh family beta-carotene 15,15'-dioxygenase [Salibaculum sp.]MDR9482973.1 Brp/Blh family beta-carotene 15,15'-dioxygenase [Salibaculum sp.]